MLSVRWCQRACPQGGFQSEMTRREAALILGVRESAPEEKVGSASSVCASRHALLSSFFLASRYNSKLAACMAVENACWPACRLHP